MQTKYEINVWPFQPWVKVHTIKQINIIEMYINTAHMCGLSFACDASEYNLCLRYCQNECASHIFAFVCNNKFQKNQKNISVARNYFLKRQNLFTMTQHIFWGLYLFSLMLKIFSVAQNQFLSHKTSFCGSNTFSEIPNKCF